MNSYDPRRSCVDLLGHMVGFNTVNSASSGIPAPERPMAEALLELARGWGLEAELLPVDTQSANLLITARVAPDAPWLLCDSHMDTVSAEGMSVDPFGGVIEHGRMSGRGACDTKCSGAAMLWALKETAAAKGLANNTAILFPIDEEVGKLGVNTFVSRQLPALGWRPALAVVGEPTLLHPVFAHNGVVRWSIETTGIPAHSSKPERGRSAITDMLKVVRAIEEEYTPGLSAEHPLTGKARCSVNIIRGGSQINVIPESCVIEVDRRIVPGEDGETVVPAVEELLRRLREQDPGLRVQQKAPFIDPAMASMRMEEVLEWAAPVLKKMSLPVEPEGVAYGTDAGNYTEAGIPSLVIGPGDIAQAHTVDEWVAVDQVDAAAELYAALFRCRLPWAGERGTGR